MVKNNTLQIRCFGLLLAPLLVLGLVGTVTSVSAVEDHAVSFHATKATTAITLDADTSDWRNISGISLTLESLDGSQTVDVEARVAYDSTNIYFLFIIHDDYDHVNSATQSIHLNPHVAVEWNINATTGPHMGADTAGSSQGTVDIWHWEIQTEAGLEVGGTNTVGDGGNDPIGNLDDEYATSPTNRRDDGAENSIRGNWDHSGKTTDFENNRVGRYVFEMKRPLTTPDVNDVQFTEGNGYNMALAYWDPDETAIGWTDSGHMVSPEKFDWIEVHLDNGDPELHVLEESLTSYVMDGATADWSEIAGLSLALESLDGSQTVDVEARVAYDANNIYFLFIIHDDYDHVNSSTHSIHLNPHIAVKWDINATTGPHMGADNAGSSQGTVDIWSWEIQTEAGLEVGGTTTAGDGGNDPIGNLDDEYATSVTSRYDDGAENSIRGNWAHSGMTTDFENDSIGRYVFEMKRPLTTTDVHDVQIAKNTTHKMALAYWDPDESATGWFDAGHMISPNTFGWIDVVFVPAPTTTTTTTSTTTTTTITTTTSVTTTEITSFHITIPLFLNIAILVLINRKRQ